MTYDGNNRLATMVDAVGTTVYNYTAFGALQSEDGPWANDAVSYSYENGRRRSGLNLQAPNASDWAQSYGYDAAGRLSTLTSPAGAFSYNYHPGLALANLATALSPMRLVQQVNLPNGAYSTNTFDDFGRLLSTALRK